MGDVDVQKVRNIDPLRVQEFTGVEPLRIGQIAPAAVHIKELNHIDPISVDSLRIDQIRNLDPVRVERFDVTYLPTVNLTLSRMPPMDVDIRRIPPLAVTVQQDFCLPSQYTIHARLLGIEFLRFEIHGTTMVSPQDRVRREQSRTHQRSFPDVAAAGNPAIPTKRIERCETVTRHVGCAPPPGIGPGPPTDASPPAAGTHHAHPARPLGFAPRPSHGGLSAGAPPFNFPATRPPADQGSSSVSWGGAA